MPDETVVNAKQKAPTIVSYHPDQGADIWIGTENVNAADQPTSPVRNVDDYLNFLNSYGDDYRLGGPNDDCSIIQIVDSDCVPVKYWVYSDRDEAIRRFNRLHW